MELCRHEWMDPNCRSSVYADSCGISFRGENAKLGGVCLVQCFFSLLVNVGGKEQRREIGRIPRATWMLYITSDPDLKRNRSREPAGQR